MIPDKRRIRTAILIVRVNDKDGAWDIIQEANYNLEFPNRIISYESFTDISWERESYIQLDEIIKKYEFLEDDFYTVLVAYLDGGDNLISYEFFVNPDNLKPIDMYANLARRRDELWGLE